MPSPAKGPCSSNGMASEKSREDVPQTSRPAPFPASRSEVIPALADIVLAKSYRTGQSSGQRIACLPARRFLSPPRFPTSGSSPTDKVRSFPSFPRRCLLLLYAGRNSSLRGVATWLTFPPLTPGVDSAPTPETPFRSGVRKTSLPLPPCNAPCESKSGRSPPCNAPAGSKPVRLPPVKS